MSLPASFTVLVVGGTGESGTHDHRTVPAGMLAHVTAALDDRFASRWVPYPASYGPATTLGGIAYDDSVAIGCANLARAFAGVDGPVMLLGYSQGAVVVRRFLGGASVDSAALRRVVAVGLVADPHQPADVVAGCTGTGVAGGDDSLVGLVPTYWVGVSDDMICNASADSMVRDIADLTAHLSFADRQAVWRWFSSMWQTVRGKTFQNADAGAAGSSVRLGRAMHEVRGYLTGGRHTSYGVEPYRVHSLTEPQASGCEILARWMQVRATYGAVPVPCLVPSRSSDLAS